MLLSEISDRHKHNFDVVERVCSVFSLVGCVFILSTFLSAPAFRKPITRLVFYASFGNMMSNVATLMARSYVGMPSSAGCQFQAFLIQMFLPADAYWTLAMAFNVYLTFYRKYDAQRLKKMEIPYLLLCYGAPFVIALTYVFIDNPRQGRMYGNALLWCWVSSGWDIWRIATFYGPAWVTIFVTFFIYIRTGRQIYRKYRTLRSLNSQNHEPEPLLIVEPFSTKTTEIFVTREIVSMGTALEGVGITTDHMGHRASAAPGAPTRSAYTVEITADANARQRTTPAHSQNDEDYDDEGDEIKPVTSRADNDFSPLASPTSQTRSGSPPYSPTTSNMSPNLGRAGASRTMSMRATNTNIRRTRRRMAVYEANNAAWSYTKCALLFFTALLITWIPSTANRVYSVIYDNEISLGLEYASAFVLPLQGFWNGLIYVFTTRKACKELFYSFVDLFDGKDSGPKSKGPMSPARQEERQSSWSGQGGRQPRDRNSYMMGFVPGNSKAGLGLPVEVYERI